MDHRGVAGNVTEFDGDLGLVIGAGGGSLTLFDAVRAHGGRPANYCEIGGNPSVRKACGLAKLVLQKPGVDKIAVMMSIVSNTRVDIVARGVVKACPSARLRPGRENRLSAYPAPGRTRASSSSSATGVEYCDRSVSMHEAARGGRREDPGEPPDVDPDRRRHHLHRPGDHRPRGRELTREALDYGAGAKIVGGVTPGRLLAAMSTASPCSTPWPRRWSTTVARSRGRSQIVLAFTKDAVFEAIENGIELIVIVTERIPRGDVAQMVELAGTRSARIIGPNCLGVIVPDVIKMGGIGGPAKDAAGVHPGTGRSDLALRRHDHRDVVDVHGGRARAVHRGVDRR